MSEINISSEARYQHSYLHKPPYAELTVVLPPFTKITRLAPEFALIFQT